MRPCIYGTRHTRMQCMHLSVEGIKDILTTLLKPSTPWVTFGNIYTDTFLVEKQQQKAGQLHRTIYDTR